MGWFENNAPQADESGQAANYPAQGGGGDFQQMFLQIMGGLPATPENLIAKERELAAAGITVQRNAAGVAGKVKFGPYGEIRDVIPNAAGGGGGAWSWGSGPGGPTGEGGKPLPGNRYYGTGYMPGQSGTLGGFMGGTDYGARLPALEKTPGYKFRFEQGQKAVEDSHAAKGTLLTGAAAKDLTEFGQGLASTEFDNEYRRLFGIAGLGQGAAGTLGGYGSSYANNATGLITGAGNAQAAGTVGAGNAWGNALGNIGNTAMQAYMYDQYLKRPPATGPTTGWM